ncbi:hypothetical protein ACF09C_29275 [Streptomyces sp. NPDC014870]|uniref:hypothetical protein n=1 Tax=Streptomyces sp. NPDC014870 TaxID=3364925 RepID=UPI0036F67568
MDYLADLLDDPDLKVGGDPGHTSVQYPQTRVGVMRTDCTAQSDYLRMGIDRGAHAHPRGSGQA